MLGVCVFLFARPSLVLSFPWLIARSGLRAISTTITIITTTRVGKPSRTIDPPKILGHLKLEVPNKPNKLLVLLYSGLNLKIRQC